MCTASPGATATARRVSSLSAEVDLDLAGEDRDGLVLLVVPLQGQRLATVHVQGLADVGALDLREDLLVAPRLVHARGASGFRLVGHAVLTSRSVADGQGSRSMVLPSAAARRAASATTTAAQPSRAPDWGAAPVATHRDEVGDGGAHALGVDPLLGCGPAQRQLGADVVRHDVGAASAHRGRRSGVTPHLNRDGGVLAEPVAIDREELGGPLRQLGRDVRPGVVGPRVEDGPHGDPAFDAHLGGAVVEPHQLAFASVRVREPVGEAGEQTARVPGGGADQVDGPVLRATRTSPAPPRAGCRPAGGPRRRSAHRARRGSPRSCSPARTSGRRRGPRRSRRSRTRSAAAARAASPAAGTAHAATGCSAARGRRPARGPSARRPRGRRRPMPRRWPAASRTRRAALPRGPRGRSSRGWTAGS